MFIFYLIFEIILLIAFVRVLFMALKKMKECKNIQDLKYLKTEEFFVLDKNLRRNNHISYRWISISTKDGQYEDSISVTNDLELFKKYNIGDNFGKRDIYAHGELKHFYITVKEGEKPNLSGEKEYIESIIYLFVSSFIVFAGIILLII